MIDKQGIATRAMNAARIAAAEWEAEHRQALTLHDRELFAYAFHQGMVQGVLEAQRAGDKT